MKLKSIKYITVYCSSSNKINNKYLKIGKNVGIFLASKKFKIVYGGGSNGIMGEVSKNAKLNGGYVIGVIPKFLKTKENQNKNIDKTIIVANMSKRKEIMFKKGDAFLALPGGPGTIEEVTEIISWYNLNIHNKPIIFFNFNKYWDPLINMYMKFYTQKFVNKKYQKLFYSVNTLSELKKLLQL